MVVFSKYFHCKGNNSYLAEEKPERQHLNQAVKVNIPGMGWTGIVAPDVALGERRVTSVALLSEMLNPNLIMRKTQTIPNWGSPPLQNNWPVLFKKHEGYERQGKIKEMFQMKETW